MVVFAALAALFGFAVFSNPVHSVRASTTAGITSEAMTTSIIGRINASAASTRGELGDIAFYNMLHGTAESHAEFAVVTGGGLTTRTGTFGPPEVFVRVTAGQRMFRVSNSPSLLYHFEVRRDSQITVANEAFNNMPARSINVTILQRTEGNFITLKDTTVLNPTGAVAAVAANAMGGVFHLAQGDELFVIFSAATGNQEVQESGNVFNWRFPSFAFDTAAYDEGQRVGVPATNITLGMRAMVAAVHTGQGAPVTAHSVSHGFTYGAYWGTPNDHRQFDLFAAEALQTNLRQTTLAAGSQVFASVFAGGSGNIIRVEAAAGNLFILKISFTEDTAVTISHAATNNAANGNNSIASVYRETVSGGRAYHARLVQRTFGQQVTANQLGGEFHVPAGDSLLFMYATANTPTNILLWPDFDMDATAFDADKVFNMAPIVAIGNHRFDLLEQIDGDKDDLDEDDFYPEEWALFMAQFERLINALNAAQTISAMNTIMGEFEDRLEGFLTIAEIDSARTDLKGQLITLLAGLSENNYTGANWAIIGDIIGDALEALDETRNVHNMQTITANAVRDVGLVLTGGRGGDGCEDMSVVGAMLVLILLVGAVVFTKKKN